MASSTSASGPVQQDQRDEHADQAHRADEQGHDAGLQERRQRVDVGRHPGHDPAGRLALVVVEAEPLQLGERLHAQQVEQPLPGPAGDPQPVVADHPLPEDDGEADAAEGEQRAVRAGGDALVDAGADDGRHQQLGDRLQADQDQAGEERGADRAQQPAQREAGGRPGG